MLINALQEGDPVYDQLVIEQVLHPVHVQY